MNQDPDIQTLRDPAFTPRKRGCGCLSLSIGAVVLILSLIVGVQLLITRTPLPMRIVASIIAKSEPDPVIMTGISGSSASGYHIARIESGMNVLEDVRLHTTGILRMIRENELIIREIHVGKARVTLDSTASDSKTQTEPGQTEIAKKGGNNFYLQMDRLSLNNMLITDRLTGTTIAIPKLEWTGFKGGKGKFDLGNILVDSNMLKVHTTNPAPGQFRIEAAALPEIHKRLLKPITFVADIRHENNRIISDIQAFDGTLRITDDADRNGKLLIQDLDLADFVDGPLPRAIRLDVEMRPTATSADQRDLHIRSGSFRLGNVPFSIQPVELTVGAVSSGKAAIIATGTHGKTEFHYAFTREIGSDDINPKPLLTAKPPMQPDAMLARIFHDADINTLDADTRRKLTEMAGWFRFSEN